MGLLAEQMFLHIIHFLFASPPPSSRKKMGKGKVIAVYLWVFFTKHQLNYIIRAATL